MLARATAEGAPEPAAIATTGTPEQASAARWTLRLLASRRHNQWQSLLRKLVGARTPPLTTQYTCCSIYLMTAKQVMDKLKKSGWRLDRINGSHYVFVRDGCRSIPVPFHGNKDLGNKAKQILKEAGCK
ncbi:MAG: hypothetical protein Ta2A_13960 [Treponemataceae bacterium]|nr:MAG: hypothetical protein Ta2A_13960 [Treponemataceae bacterium]